MNTENGLLSTFNSLSGYRPLAQRHPYDGGHVRLGPEHVQGDPQVLANVAHYPAKLKLENSGTKLRDNFKLKSKLWTVKTPHDSSPESLLVVRSCPPHKDPDVVLPELDLLPGLPNIDICQNDHKLIVYQMS